MCLDQGGPARSVVRCGFPAFGGAFHAWCGVASRACDAVSDGVSLLFAEHDARFVCRVVVDDDLAELGSARLFGAPVGVVPVAFSVVADLAEDLQVVELERKVWMCLARFDVVDVEDGGAVRW